MISGSSILERVIDPTNGSFSAEMARYILELDFAPSDHARYEALCERAQSGNLSEEERAGLEEYLDVNDFITLLKAKARKSLRPQVPVA